MLTDLKLVDYFERHSLALTAREYITLTRSSPPFRRVGDHAISNVCIQFASRKMGRTIQAESRTAEYAYALEFEYSNDVLEFWDQPAPVPVTRTLAGTSKRTSDYTPDYLVLSKAGPWVVEVKDGNAIRKLAEQRPSDWHVAGLEARYLPAALAFERLELKHVVCSTSALSRTRTANLRLLLRARAMPCEADEYLARKVDEAFGNAPFMTLEKLAEAVCVTDLTPLLALIDSARLHARLSDDLLSEPRTCWIAADPSRLDLVPKELTYQAPGGSEAPTRLPSQKAMAHYAMRMDRLNEKRQGRSERRWRAVLKKAEMDGSSAFDALCPRFDRCGNRSPRINPKCENFLTQFISEKYASSKRPPLRFAFRSYTVDAELGHPEFPPVSYATFRKRVLSLDPTLVAAGRGGRRAANAAAPPTDIDSRAIKPRRPFEAGSLDHYNANIHVVIGERGGKRYTARPWISGLIDLFTGLILAIWVSLRPPSSHACAIVLRRCVRAHQRLPESIVVDRGSDFRSLFFMSTLASSGVDRVLRPAAHARFGSEIERLFGEFETQWLPTLAGNFAARENARSISSTHGPASTAELSIEDFWASCLEFIEWRNSTASKLGQPERLNMHKTGLATFACSGIEMHETAEFVVDTAVDVREVTLEPNGCVRVGEQRFWAPELGRLRPKGKASVRIEPENPHVCYVQVGDRWVTAKTGDATFYDALDPVARFAESMRLRECVSVRVALRDEAHREFLRGQREVSSPPSSPPTTLPLPFVNTPPDRKVSLFERARSLEVAAFDDAPTEVLKYVLGQSG